MHSAGPETTIRTGRARDIAKLRCSCPFELMVIRVLGGGSEWYRPAEKLIASIPESTIACLGPRPPPEAVSESGRERKAKLAAARAHVAQAQRARGHLAAMPVRMDQLAN